VWPVAPTGSVVPDATLRPDMRTPIRLLFCLALLVVTATVSLTQEQQFASLGDLKLQSGEMIRDCRIGYRTFGQLNADESNAVLFPTWFGGTTKDLVSSIGPGEIFDSSRYYIIAVDALSDGVSSSPSNSKLQPGMRFPRITIRDMVESQHELLTRVLHINHLKAVMGISMGGMQTFQWMVMYPDFMDKAVPIVGSPRLAAYDLLLWQSEIDSIKNNRAWKNGHYNQNLDLVGQAEFTALFLTTPDYYNQVTSREQVFEQLQKAKQTPAIDANDKIRDAEAMMALDISQPFGGSMERAAAAVRAKVFVIVSKHDHMVTPGPATDFAHLLKAAFMELDSDCGHLAPDCEQAKIKPAIAAFLEK
jgi:homoserine acetyltransferase